MSTNPSAAIADAAEQPSRNLVPWPLKVGYTIFTIVLVYYYWQEYGPTNFVYFCDVALFLGVATVWTERPLYASMAAVGITLPQLLWQVDFVGTLIGLPVTGMTDYMFDEKLTLFARGLSFFHFWLPFFLLFLVWRLGYDRRAFLAWTVLAWLLMLVAYFMLPGPGEPLSFPKQPYNVNYVYGLNDKMPQTWMPPLAWLGCLFVGLPLCFYLPTHLALLWMDHRRPARHT